MNKEKLKLLLSNLVGHLFNGIFTFMMLWDLTKHDGFSSAIIAVVVWTVLAQMDTNIDYLKERIKKLEDKQNEQELRKTLPSTKILKD